MATAGAAIRLSESPFLDHLPGVLKRLRKSREYLIDLAFAYDEGRTESDDVAGHVAQVHAILLRAANEEGCYCRLRIEALLGLFVANDFDRADEADTARFSDERMIAV